MRFVRAGTVLALAFVVAACSQTRSPEQPEQPINDCARCHGYPPATATHPANGNCHLCHPGTVEADNVTLVAGGLHQNGVVDSTGHAPGYVLVHGADALAFLGGGAGNCTACHTDFGAGSTGKSCDGCHATAVAASAPGWRQNCSFCHGTRTADVTAASAAAAPPQAVNGAAPDQTFTNERVGAHQAHLTPGEFSNALACDSCHAVPAAGDLGHLAGYDGSPADVTFSALASQNVSSPAYGAGGGTCAVYCHGSGSSFANPAGTESPAWTSQGIACGDCHAVPPASGPTYLAPNAHEYHLNLGATCGSCHAGYTATQVNLATHVNGTKDVSPDGTTVVTGWDCGTCHGAIGVPPASHPVPYATHTVDALANIAACTSCHGADYGGGLNGLAPSCNGCHEAVPGSAPDWKQNCTFCHGTRTAGVLAAAAAAAPPMTVDKTDPDQTRANPKVGAHQAHLTAGPYAAAFACETCHAVPADPLGHFTGGAAALTFSPLAVQGVTSPGYAGSGGSCAVYCHGSGSLITNGANRTPAWTSTGLQCDACHTTAPTSGFHEYHQGQGVACASCHPGYVVGVSVDTATHVNGTLEASPTTIPGTTLSAWPASCTVCHPN